ncbi:MAG: hypothetical protein HZA10_08110 [Nitrospirae bacterium]|nr:hypothetical protein [Nitrospirota bacterium]
MNIKIVLQEFLWVHIPYPSFRLVRNLSEGCSKGFPTRFACGNDIHTTVGRTIKIKVSRGHG